MDMALIACQKLVHWLDGKSEEWIDAQDSALRDIYADAQVALRPTKGAVDVATEDIALLNEKNIQSTGLDIPGGYDAICGFCHYPFIFKQAQGCGAKECKKYCCFSCENGITVGRSRR